MPVVPAAFQLVPPSVDRSTLNPSSFIDWSVHTIVTAVLPSGYASVPEGVAGGAEAVAALALFETSEDPPSFLARTPYQDRKSTRLNSSHSQISYAVFCLKKKKKKK